MLVAWDICVEKMVFQKMNNETKKNGNGSSNGNGNGGNGAGNGNGGSGGNGGGNGGGGMGESIIYEKSNPRIPRKPQDNQQNLKNTLTYILMKILKELFMDLVSRTLLKQKRLYQKSGILLDRMLIKFKRLLLWNKGRERWVKPLKPQSTESISMR